MWLGCLLVALPGGEAGGGAAPAAPDRGWYERTFFLLHEDHHVERQDPVGRGADPAQIARWLREARPDHVQMIGKGAYGLTTYPTAAGFAPPQLGADVLGLWRDAARAANLRFGVYVNPCNDREIRIRHPGWLRLGPDGKPRDSAPRSPQAYRSGMVGSDGRLWSIALCLRSGAIENYVWPILREVLDRYAPDSLWLDGLGGTADPCHCRACRDEFQRRTGLAAPPGPTGPGWSEFQAFHRETYHDFLRRTLAEVHRLRPACLVTHNGAYTPWMPEEPPAGLGFLSKDYLDHGDMISPHSHYLDSVGLPFEIMTEVFTANPDLPPDQAWTEHETRPKAPEQIRRELAAILANGGRYNLWDIPARSSALVEERLPLIAREVAPFLRAREPWCLGTRLPDVSVAHSTHAHYAKLAAGPKVFGDDRKWLRDVDDRLRELHLNYEYAPDWRLARGDVRGQVLLVEDPAAIAPAFVEDVLRHARQGGRVIWTGQARQPALEAALGLRFDGAAAVVGPVTLEGGAAGPAFAAAVHRVQPGAARVLLHARTAAGERLPYLLVNEVGRGRIYYAASPVLAPAGPGVRLPPASLQALWRQVLPDAERHLTAEASPAALVTLRRKDGNTVVHVANLHPGRRRTATWRGREYQIHSDIPPLPAGRVSVRLPRAPAAVVLQPQGTQVSDWRYRAGRLEVAVPPVESHQLIVVTP